MPLMLYLLFAAMVGNGIWQGQAWGLETGPAHYYFHGEPEKALALYLKAASAGDASAVIDASVILQELGRNSEAIALLEKTLSTDPDAPDDPELSAALAWAYLYSGNNAKSGELFAAVHAGGRVPRALLGLAFSRMQSRRYEEADELLKKLAADRSLSALAWYCRGLIAEEEGAAGKAADYYAKALKEDSHFVEGRPRLAQIYENQNRMDDAWKQYSKIVAMDPSHKLAVEKKQSLLALLTKKPEEILEVKKIREFARVSPAPSREESPEIRVAIGTTAGGKPVYKKRLDFRVSGPFALVDPKSGKELGVGKRGEPCAVTVATGAAVGRGMVSIGAVSYPFSGSVLVRPRDQGKSTIILETVSYAQGMAWSGVADKELRGDLEIIFDPAKNGLFIINRLPLEEYLYGVIAAEMPVHWPQEALKTQAVIARTYALHLKNNLHPHSALGYHLCDEQHCQVYSGVAVESQKARTAADLTRGGVMAYKGKPIHSVFSSNCGGHTQRGSAAGWADLPYWRMVHDGADSDGIKSPGALAAFLRRSPEVYCKTSKYTWAPEFRWARLISAEDLLSRLKRKAALGKLKKMIFTRSESGRIASVTFVGTAGQVKLTKEHEIRRFLGLAPLRSTMFAADVFYDKDFVKGLLIYGGGWGHGVGLCQSGAAGRAEAGLTYEQILPAYYPGAALSDLRYLK
jgi:SpoIID/LytB domain protein